MVDAGVKDIACEDLVSRLKELRSALRIVVVGRPGHWQCEGADHYWGSSIQKNSSNFFGALNLMSRRRSESAKKDYWKTVSRSRLVSP